MKARIRPIPKGRAVDAKALAEVQQLLGDAPRRRDLLIEHLHLLNDRFGHLPAAHLAALAQEMRLALTEVYEDATFEKVRAAVEQKQHDCPVAPYIGYKEYRKDGGYQLIRDCLAGKRTREA